MNTADVKRMDAWAEEMYGPITPYRHQTKGFVYFIRSVKGGPIKIGWAQNPEGRCRELQTAHPYPLEVVAAVQVPRTKERELHQRFKASRIPGGEWFEPTPELLALMGSM